MGSRARTQQDRGALGTRHRIGVRSATSLSSLVLALCCLTSPALAEPTLAPPEQAVGFIACSTPGIPGGVTRDQIVARGLSWVNAKVPYSQSTCRRDANGSYRMDCSGFVSMAWGLSRSYVTAEFVRDSSLWKTIGWADLAPGDAVVKNGHMFLFVAWANSGRTSMRAYEETHPGKGTVASTRSVASSQADGFHPIRYTKIVTPPPPGGSASETASKVRWADFDGDGKDDYVVVYPTGQVKVWLNRGGDGRGGWLELGQVATGLTADRTRVRLTDFDGDGKADYVYFDASGGVYVALNRGGDGRGGWVDQGRVATGYGPDREQVRFADLTGDARTDYLFVSSSGAVRAAGNLGGDGRGGWSDLGQIATGTTNQLTRVRFADFDGDGIADYLRIDPGGAVHVWLNRGGDLGGGWLDHGVVATGTTSNADQVRFADFDGDRRDDYVVVNLNGSVNVWLNRGGDGRGGWLELGKVATGVVVE